MNTQLVKVGSQLVKHAPKIITYVGIGGFVVTAGLAAKETLSLEPILDEHNIIVDEIKEQLEGSPGYYKEMSRQYLRTTGKILKLYGPAIATGVASGAAVLYGHKIMSGRNAALAAAAKVLESSFNKYRGRVIEEFGQDKDREYRYGIRKEKPIEDIVNEEGKVVAKKGKEVETINPDEIGDYARWFDRNSTQWDPNPEINLLTLRSQEAYMNDLLHSRADHKVWLNDVYDALGIPRTAAGSIMGWAIHPDHPEWETYIDFGIYDAKNARSRDFINGYERVFLVNPNVQGCIFDLM